MLFPDRTDDGKVALYHRATGERVVRWPVDARDLMASGQYAIAPATENAQAHANASAMSASAAPTRPAVSPIDPPFPPARWKGQPCRVIAVSGDRMTILVDGYSASDTVAASEVVFTAADATPDPVPHVTAAMQANAGMTPIGAPLVLDTRFTAGPAVPIKLPTPGHRTSRGKR